MGARIIAHLTFGRVLTKYSCNCLLRSHIRLSENLLHPRARFYSVDSPKGDDIGENAGLEVALEAQPRRTREESETEAELRNISRLPPTFHKRMIHVRNASEDVVILEDCIDWPLRESLKRQRKIYGKYGKKSGVNPGVMWPTEEELHELIEYESEFEPTLQKRWAKISATRTEEEREKREREAHVEQQMSKMPEYIEKFRVRLHKRDRDEQESEKRKQVLLDEAREYFGYKMDTRDPRFQEMQEAKTEEEQKLKKKRKKEEKQARVLARLQSMSAQKTQLDSVSEDSDIHDTEKRNSDDSKT